jgi:hypothetical protein
MKEAEYGFKVVKNEQTETETNLNFMRNIPNSQFYTTLEMIKENLKYLEMCYAPVEESKIPNTYHVK